MSAIELELLTTFAIGFAVILAATGLVCGITLLGWELVIWRQDRHDRRVRAGHAPPPRQECPVVPLQTPATPRKGQGPINPTLADDSRSQGRTARLFVMRPEVPEDQMELLDVTDPRHDGLRCAQGMWIVRDGRK
jgi:hypothetical protein